MMRKEGKEEDLARVNPARSRILLFYSVVYDAFSQK